jgi:hypothetical protein
MRWPRVGPWPELGRIDAVVGFSWTVEVPATSGSMVHARPRTSSQSGFRVHVFVFGSTIADHDWS